MVDIKNDCVHLPERKGMDERLERAEVGFLFLTLVCEELRLFLCMLSTKTKPENGKVIALLQSFGGREVKGPAAAPQVKDR